ncbi:ABC transporter ATP-binding protein [Sporosarcina newyorkensis]|uniref:ABC-2 type transport system ATP-binding protein n=2 Tax=Sporosarcina newyorkensis TaxID=759851 RepID=A0A1T4YWV3_9BACL|nr:ABC transporter ATP-binding protein [Sporosarcina newyorkensis]EGQ24192.1 ABC superfamily ATP binding cassette transporter, ABC protein [Sporosarcina newyorkensis 2681]SKB06123.1 ABC-2 type transport system ATP-binding protein [Sporosarcina newyorkensis]
MVVQIEGVTKRFGSRDVLHDIHMHIPEHSIFGFVGANGAGKTTLMKCMLGLLPLTGGAITIAGEKVTFGETKSNAHIGFLPDVPEFYPFYNARQYLELCAVVTDMPKKEWKQRIDELLELVGLADVTSLIRTYSRGMKQRLGIAQALLNRPKLLICDEPTSALDPAGRAQILSILQKAKAETTVFFSTHILSDAEQICDHVAMLHKGEIIFQEELAKLKQQFHDQFVYTFTVPAKEAMKQLASTQAKMHIEDDTLIVSLPNDRARLVFMRELTQRELIVQSIHPQTRMLEQVVLEVLG